ncbi:hypothetical protein BCY86_08990 [Pajaroellobacter abortibovis]|uniref:Uncharacterized protein n=1 Tax=Pajaroellobacter abortibovis TaxID=1882918 RepID=A0A1L6MZD6_9BACT|nr:hypothetical protein BCY86_08990 [Pajaroellobacter abortibovis]
MHGEGTSSSFLEWSVDLPYESFHDVVREVQSVFHDSCSECLCDIGMIEPSERSCFFLNSSGEIWTGAQIQMEYS